MKEFGTKLNGVSMSNKTFDNVMHVESTTAVRKQTGVE